MDECTLVQWKMKGSIHNEKRKKQLIVIAILYTVFAIGSMLYLAAEINHQCLDEHCAICAMVQQVEQSRKSAVGGLPCMVVLLLAMISTWLCDSVSTQPKRRTSLVLCKVRMDD